MYTYQPIDLLHLTPKDQALLAPLLKHRQHLFQEKLKEEDKLLVFVAFQAEKPIGIAFGYAYPTIGQGFIRDLHVSQEHCGKGVGSNLLLKLTALFKENFVKLLTWQFNSWDPGTESLEKILQKQGWAPPKVLLERYKFDSATFEPDWYKAPEPILPKDYKIFLWRYLKKKDKEKIKTLIIPNSILQDISPLGTSLPIEPINSLGLRLKEEVVGWMITNRLEPDTICYSALYIHPEIRGIGPAIALLKESIRRHKEAKVKWGLTEINMKRTPKYWRNFVQKRLAPYACQKDYVMLTFLSL